MHKKQAVNTSTEQGQKKIDAGKQKYLLCLAFGNLQRYAAWSGFCLHFLWEWERYNSIDSF